MSPVNIGDAINMSGKNLCLVDEQISRDRQCPFDDLDGIQKTHPKQVVLGHDLRNYP